MAGSPPSPREDCSVGYDTKTCQLVFFGGWRQGWLGDLHCLNVAGIVGPPYAVQSVEPSTGPVTGNTPVTLHGIGFIEASQVQVKFSDGRREATVPGKFVSSQKITCNTPSFEKYGPMEVVVRVAIKGDPFTVNKAMFNFFVNTKAAKCMAFGPGLLPVAGKSGRKLSFIMQAKDSTGKPRNSGDDAIKVQVSSAGLVEDVPYQIHDFMDGIYRITYQPPAPGKYTVNVMLDENWVAKIADFGETQHSRAEPGVSGGASSMASMKAPRTLLSTTLPSTCVLGMCSASRNCSSDCRKRHRLGGSSRTPSPPA